MRQSVITGWGRGVPTAVLSNADLEATIDTTDEWITSRTGIKERRISHINNSDMATVAARHALAAAGVDATDVDLVIMATCTPDRLVPSAASMVQDKLGARGAASFDLNAACSGFIYGLSVASGMVRSGIHDRVLLIGSELLHKWLDLNDRSTAVLFGDGAGAVVIEAREEGGRDAAGVLAVDLGTDRGTCEALTVYGSGSEPNPDPGKQVSFQMDGREVFRRAVISMGEAALKVTEEAGWDLRDVDLLIPHQANVRIIDATARRLDLPPDKVFVNIASYGNTSAASIPIALCEALEDGRIQPGDRLVFVAFGGGLTWAAAAVRWGDRVEPVGTSDAEIGPAPATGLDMLLEQQIGKVRRASA